jgi:hypothetical protein
MPDTAPETEKPQTPEELLTELAQLHIRTIVPPSPKHPSAHGWQAIAGCQAAGFARTLHALMQVAPEKAAEITDWYQGPFEEGPDPEEHTDWIERTVAKDVDTLDAWITEARELAVKAKEVTERRDKELADTEMMRDFNRRSAEHVMAKRDLAEAVLTEWENGTLEPEQALRMIRAALALGDVPTIDQLRTTPALTKENRPA